MTLDNLDDLRALIARMLSNIGTDGLPPISQRDARALAEFMNTVLANEPVAWHLRRTDGHNIVADAEQYDALILSSREEAREAAEMHIPDGVECEINPVFEVYAGDTFTVGRDEQVSP